KRLRLPGPAPDSDRSGKIPGTGQQLSGNAHSRPPHVRFLLLRILRSRRHTGRSRFRRFRPAPAVHSAELFHDPDSSGKYKTNVSGPVLQNPAAKRTTETLHPPDERKP